MEYDPISQTEQYTSGVYREQILTAVRARAGIDAVLSRYRLKQAAESEQAADDYFPYKPYCDLCERDLTTVTAYDDETTELAYTCECGFGETVRLAEHDRGKLVWKVDWPMRWAYEGVIFEPSGVDHHSPVRRGSWAASSWARCSAGSSRSAPCTRSSASPAWPR